MKVAVTGSSGYLGQLVLQALDADPAVTSLVGLDIHPSRFTSAKLTHRFADVRTANFLRYLDGCDAVYHLAFIVQPPKGMSMATIDDINIGGSRRVFEAAIAVGATHIIYASSIAAYGAHPDNPTGISEDFPLRPNSDWYYSRTKGTVERMLDQLQQAHPDQIIIRFRPGIFIGPTTNNTMGKMFEAPLMFLVRPHDLVDLCWDTDIADAFHLALHHKQSDIFNLTGANPRSLREYADAVNKRVIEVPDALFKLLARATHALGLISEADYHWTTAMVGGPIIVSAARARDRLGWTPQHDATSTLLAFAHSRDLL